MNGLVNQFNDWMHTHPHYGYLLAAIIAAFWLLGIILGWKWTYESSTWKENTLREMLGERGYRIGVGVLVAIILILSLSEFFYANRKAYEQTVPKTTRCQVLVQETLHYQMEGDGCKW